MKHHVTPDQSAQDLKLSTDNQPSITHLGKFYAPEFGGMEQVIQSIAEYSETQGFPSRVIAFTRRAELLSDKTFPNVERHLARITIKSLPLSWSYFRSLKRVTTKIIHVHTPNPLACSALRFAPNDIPIIITHHADILDRKLAKLVCQSEIDYAYRRAKFIVTTTENYANSSPEIQTYRHKLRTIPLATDIPIKYQKKTELPDEKIILAIGRHTPYKGFSLLINAYKRLKNNCSLVLIGSGPLTTQLKEQAKGVDRVTFITDANENEKIKWLEKAHVLCLPALNRAEAFGVVLIEALAAGLPVITTEINSGTTFVNIHDQTGYNIPPNDESALADSLNAIFENQDRWLKFSRNSRERYLENFTIGKMGSSYCELYKEILQLD